MMKNIFLVIPLILSLFSLLLGCDPLAKESIDFYQSTKSVELSNENIEGIFIDSTEEDVALAFGSPKKVKEIQNPKSKYLIYDGVEFGMGDHKVIRYYFQNEYRTSKGVKRGDARDKVIEEYGGNYYERVEGGLDTVGYFDKENQINIEFSFQENKVLGIMVQKLGWNIEE